MRRVLLLTTSYGGTSDSHAIRIRNLLRKLDSRRFAVHVITVKGSDSVVEQPVVKVTETAVPLLIYLEGFARRIPVFGKRLHWLISNIVYRLAIPDRYAGWRFLAFNAAVRLDAVPDVVLSSSGSPEAHLAAKKISSSLKIPWIADYGDPWHFLEKTFRPSLAGRIEAIERRTLSTAGALVFTTQATTEQYRMWLGVQSVENRFHCLPYGYVAEDLCLLQKPPTEQQALWFAHVGTAHRADRNLLPFIEGLKLFDRDRDNEFGLILAGRRSEIFDVSASELKNVQLYGQVPYVRSIELQATADVLVIVGNVAGAQVPGKVFICLGLRKPILYLRQAPHDQDEAAKLLSRFGGVIFSNNETTEIVDAVSVLAMNFDNFSNLASSRDPSEFESAALASGLERIIEDLCL